jgi:hypothetical protein
MLSHLDKKDHGDTRYGTFKSLDHLVLRATHMICSVFHTQQTQPQFLQIMGSPWGLRSTNEIAAMEHSQTVVAKGNSGAFCQLGHNCLTPAVHYFTAYVTSAWDGHTLLKLAN